MLFLLSPSMATSDGVSPQDLPLIAIDSFRHMYLFPEFEDIR